MHRIASHQMRRLPMARPLVCCRGPYPKPYAAAFFAQSVNEAVGITKMAGVSSQETLHANYRLKPFTQLFEHWARFACADWPAVAFDDGNNFRGRTRQENFVGGKNVMANQGDLLQF